MRGRAQTAIETLLEEQTGLLQDLSRDFNIHRAEATYLPHDLRDQHEGLLADYRQYFGGRDEELAALGEFIEQETCGYYFVTGESGYGKSALLANWIGRAEENGYHVAYHFIRRDRDNAGLVNTLQTLCQQLAAFHRLAGRLPDAPNRLRVIYRKMLKLMPQGNRRLVVVLDGLDEARELEAGAPARGPVPAAAVGRVRRLLRRAPCTGATGPTNAV